MAPSSFHHLFLILGTSAGRDENG